MNEFEHEVSFEAFETYEARQVAESNLRALEGMVSVAVESNLEMSTHEFSLVHPDYRQDALTFLSPLDARRIAAQATDLFYALFDEEKRSARNIHHDDHLPAGQCTVWIAEIAGKPLRIIETEWEPQHDHDLGLKVIGQLELERTRPTLDVLPTEQKQGRLRRLNSFLGRIFKL